MYMDSAQYAGLYLVSRTILHNPSRTRDIREYKRKKENEGQGKGKEGKEEKKQIKR
jgi:hypothetical protein